MGPSVEKMSRNIQAAIQRVHYAVRHTIKDLPIVPLPETRYLPLLCFGMESGCDAEPGAEVDLLS